MKYYTVKSENFLFPINIDRKVPYVPFKKRLKYLIKHNTIRIAR